MLLLRMKEKEAKKMVIQEKTIRLIALDLDGTLLRNNLEISKRNQEAIMRAKNKGVHVLFSTGRPADFCFPLMEQLNLEGYIITTSGGEIWTTDAKLIERNIFDPILFKKLWEIAKEFSTHYWLISTEKEFREEDHMDGFSNHQWLKIGYHSEDQEILKEIRKKLQRFQNIEITNSHPNNIEVNPSGVNKADAIKKVGKKLGISLEEVMAVGDSLNDATMIERCGLGVAMGNAQPKIKEIADYITDTNENDGVAKVIERFVL